MEQVHILVAYIPRGLNPHLGAWKHILIEWYMFTGYAEGVQVHADGISKRAYEHGRHDRDRMHLVTPINEFLAYRSTDRRGVKLVCHS